MTASTTRKTKSTSRTPAARKPAGATSRSTAIRSFSAAINFLNSTTNYERMLRPSYNHINFNLSRMLRLLSGIGNPHKDLKTVHVAGTKGKGSVCHMLASVLEEAGYKVGLYTSPHIVNIRERIQVNGKLISESAFARTIADIAPVVRKVQKDPPTFFDMMTAAAFSYFRDQEVDIAIIETGLGGRLDSTNVLKPLVCGLTGISYDHMGQLGTSLEQIAEEKAGIIKPSVPVVVAPQDPGVEKVFRAAAEKTGSEIRFVGQELDFSHRFESSRASGPQNRVCMTTKSMHFDHLSVPLHGDHQADNCGVVLGLLDALQQDGFTILPQHAMDGLSKVRIPGRVEVIRDLPLTIVDIAHNAASIRALMRAIGQNFNYDSMVVIFAASIDKDIDGMLDQLRLGADKVIFTTNGTPRSADPNDLLNRFAAITQKMAQVAPTLQEADRIARTCVTRDDLICITGSTYVVGQAKDELQSVPV